MDSIGAIFSFDDICLDDGSAVMNYETARKIVNEIPEGRVFWKDDTGVVFAQSYINLINYGMSEEQAYDFLDILYYAVADCYGG